jgi:primosomal protein N' (replication factor Y)
MFAQIAVPLPLPSLTYRVPEGLELRAGDPVKVKVRKKLIDGIVMSLSAEGPVNSKFEIKALEGMSDEFPTLSEETLSILQWAADYYHCPIGEVLRGFLPPDPAPRLRESWNLSAETRANAEAGRFPRGKTQKALIERLLREGPAMLVTAERAAARKLLEAGSLTKEMVRDEVVAEPPPASSKDLNLTNHQAEALAQLRASLNEKKFSTYLLQGVTGSGKTEVYLRAAAHTLSLGKTVLVVVPEIALTPQLLARFRARLGKNIAVLHSGISDGERSHMWHLLNRGIYRVCIGARSAAFAPMKDLGLIVVDEEHDSALKQEDHLRYNGRDLCIMRGSYAQATVVLGSATPSLETYRNAQLGRFKHILLPERASGKAMPEVAVVDRTKTGTASPSISSDLKRAMDETLLDGGQIMLLLNRRGHSSFLICALCGHVPECPNCSVSLTNYQSARRLKCHYCGHSEKTHDACVKCGANPLLSGTLGTESLEEEIKALYPTRKVIRIDRESMERKGALEAALGSIASGETEIVIGTQIIAKGHDFPNIALVGVVNADSSFHLPDFRASEKSFQLFTQMAGRAGRGGKPGRVILQTYNPRHPSIEFSTRHDYRGFSEDELRVRHTFHYPPFTRMARILISATDANLAEKSAEQIASLLHRYTKTEEVEVIGPAPAALAKVQNRYRWNIILKSAKLQPLHRAIDSLSEFNKEAPDRRVLLQVDVDPVSLM